ncbi:hypothetical protein BGZ70_005882 [Mortierella alpina]|uniref:Uncharacterized protein n=1 Tax=Mortierella alpina TaxID=64518 RepID=A0A9P6JHL5_MORAP|nr:hypothetical protein BGZ70_005882 [Mortierella alpina]
MTLSTALSTEFDDCSYRRREHQCVEKVDNDTSGYCKFHRGLANHRDPEKRKVTEWITGSEAQSKVKALIDDKYKLQSKERHFANKTASLLSQIEDLKRANVDLQAKVDKLAKAKKQLKKTNGDLQAKADKLTKAKEQFNATEDVVTDLVNKMSVIKLILKDDDIAPPHTKLPPPSSLDKNEP